MPATVPTTAASVNPPGRARRGRSRIGLGIVLTTGLAGSWFLIQSSFRTGSGARLFTLRDDPMISLDFAHTFATGHGFLWYPGAPRVDAVTNPLWTFIMAIPASLGVPRDALPLVVSVIGLLTVVAAALAAAKVVDLMGPVPRNVTLTAGLAVGLCYPLVFWSLRGFEIGLFVWCMLATVAALIVLDRGRSRTASVVLVLAVVSGVATRLDFVIVPAVSVLWLSSFGRPGKRRLPLLLIVCSTIIAAGVVLGLQQWYFGSALPNTFTDKVSGVPLGPRFERGLINVVHSFVAWLALPFCAAVSSTRRDEPPRRFAALLWALIVAFVAYDIWVGGDAWEFFPFADRFLTPVVVLLLVLAAHAVPRVLRWMRIAPFRRGVLVMAAVVLQVAVLPMVVDRWGPAVSSLQLETPSAWSVTWLIVLAGIVIVGPTLVARSGQSRHQVAWVVFAAVVLSLGAWIPRITTTQVAHPYTAWDTTLRLYGQALGRATDPGARIAVFAAGGITYYSNRRTLDILGLVDPVVARSKPHLAKRFPPGHQKWDFGHTVGHLRPDIVAQFWTGWGPAQRRRLVTLGYVPMHISVPPGTPSLDLTVWALHTSKHIRWDYLQPLGTVSTRPSTSGAK